jgi:hypothetical protein
VRAVKAEMRQTAASMLDGSVAQQQDKPDGAQRRTLSWAFGCFTTFGLSGIVGEGSLWQRHFRSKAAARSIVRTPVRG